MTAQSACLFLWVVNKGNEEFLWNFLLTRISKSLTAHNANFRENRTSLIDYFRTNFIPCIEKKFRLLRLGFSCGYLHLVLMRQGLLVSLLVVELFKFA